MYRTFVMTLFLLSGTIIYGQQGERQKQFNLSDGHLAIQGYDPVGYFTEHKAVEGKSAFKKEYKGIVYQFSSKQHLDMFASSPEKYEPEYGGWCAYAMGAKGEKVEVDPETFKIIDGKLYLFYNKFFNNTLKSWNKDEGHLKQQADKNWTSLNNDHS